MKRSEREPLVSTSKRDWQAISSRKQTKSELQLNIMQISHLWRLLCKHHGLQHPEMVMAEIRFSILAEEILLMSHKEKCAKVSHNGPEILITRDESEFIKALLRDIRKLTDNYTLPPDACKIYEEAYDRMKLLDAKVTSHLSCL